MEIWRMTLQEYIESMKGKKINHFYYNRKGQLIHNHQIAIETALQLGKDVPERVLQSMYYPFNITIYRSQND